MTTNQPIL